MSLQVPLFDNMAPKSSKMPARLEEIVGHGFDIRKFVENFNVLVDVAGGTKHLKEMVLQLAVRGGLSAPTIESADSLVVDLHQARAGLATTGVRLGVPSQPVADDEAPHVLPPGWRWVRFRDFGGFLGGGTPSKSNDTFWKGPLPWVSPKDMKRPYINDAEDHISMAAVEGSAVKLIPARSILYVVRGMILAHSFPVAVTTREVTINQDMKALVLAMPEVSEFVLRSFQAARRRVLATVERSSHGTCRLESESVEMLPIALPPLAEQKRIVAKVDQLMALCDDLEARQTKKREVGTRLTKSALEALTTAEGPEEFNAAWKRVVENFDVLIDRADKVNGLRKAVLSAAIRGRLSTRRVSDVPAGRFLERLRGERVASRGAGSKVTEPLEPPFALPPSWIWARLDHLWRSITDGDHQPPPKSERGVAFLTIGNLSGGKIDFSSTRYVPESYFEGLDELRVPSRGDLLYTVVGSYGIPMIVDTDRPFCVQRHVAILKPLPSTNVEFSRWLMESDFVYRQAQQTATGIAQPTVGLGVLRSFLVPVPPPEEQARIVAKVDHLIKVCDDLETRLGQAEDRAAKLIGAVVQELVMGESRQ